MGGQDGKTFGIGFNVQNTNRKVTVSSREPNIFLSSLFHFASSRTVQRAVGLYPGQLAVVVRGRFFTRASVGKPES